MWKRIVNWARAKRVGLKTIGTHVALLEAKAPGFENWPDHDVVVAFLPAFRTIVVRVRDADTAQRLFGPKGLKRVLPLLGPSWVGTDILGQSRPDEVCKADAISVASTIAAEIRQPSKGGPALEMAPSWLPRLEPFGDQVILVSNASEEALDRWWPYGPVLVVHLPEKKAVVIGVRNAETAAKIFGPEGLNGALGEEWHLEPGATRARSKEPMNGEDAVRVARVLAAAASRQ